jgi:hypothetical protein
MKIAVCDDSREDRDALRALLEVCGHDFEIREYGSGAELYADTPELPHQHEVYRETQQLCHGADHGEGDIRPEVQVPGSEEAVHIV